MLLMHVNSARNCVNLWFLCKNVTLVEHLGFVVIQSKHLESAQPLVEKFSLQLRVTYTEWDTIGTEFGYTMSLIQVEFNL